MANKVTAQVIGGQPKTLDQCDTVQDALSSLGLEGNFTATVNGDPADLEDSLDDFSFVAFSAAVKGGK